MRHRLSSKSVQSVGEERDFEIEWVRLDRLQYAKLLRLLSQMLG